MCIRDRARYGETVERILQAYNTYEFQTISHALNNFLTVDMSAFYVDISKDRLYTYGAKSPERRSVQTAIYLITNGITRMLAPLLPVTMDELWKHLPGNREDSVHLSDLPKDSKHLIDHALLEEWSRLLSIRDAVNSEIEQLRQLKTVGTSLEARVELRAMGETAHLLKNHQDDLPMLFIASDVELIIDQGSSPRASTSAEGSTWNETDGSLAIRVERVGGVKCPRCWRYVKSLSSDSTIGDLCPRCLDALSERVIAN